MGIVEVFIKRKKNEISAHGKYNFETQELIVEAGSIVSKEVSTSTKYRGINAIKKRRELYVENNVVQENILFSSASTAASFIMGNSVNGLRIWKNNEGISIKELSKKGDS